MRNYDQEIKDLKVKVERLEVEALEDEIRVKLSWTYIGTTPYVWSEPYKFGNKTISTTCL